MKGQYRQQSVGVVYLIHFDRPYRHARHYTGWTTNLDARLLDHAKGRGANLIRVISSVGIGWVVARTVVGTRHRERKLKSWGWARRGNCPVCRGDLPQYVTGAVPFEKERAT